MIEVKLSQTQLTETQLLSINQASLLFSLLPLLLCLFFPIRIPTNLTSYTMIGHHFVVGWILIGLLGGIWAVSQSERWRRDVSNAGRKKTRRDSFFLSHACASHGARCWAAKRGNVLIHYYLTLEFPLLAFILFNSWIRLILHPGAAMTVEQNVLQQHSQKVTRSCAQCFAMRQSGKVSISLAS